MRFILCSWDNLWTKNGKIYFITKFFTINLFSNNFSSASFILLSIHSVLLATLLIKLLFIIKNRLLKNNQINYASIKLMVFSALFFAVVNYQLGLVWLKIKNKAHLNEDIKGMIQHLKRSKIERTCTVTIVDLCSSFLELFCRKWSLFIILNY